MVHITVQGLGLRWARFIDSGFLLSWGCHNGDHVPPQVWPLGNAIMEAGKLLFAVG
ncbi:uncharacterized protein EI90DRAFT_3058677 [Cantharellus anzutake]|uniref:uncharacterized protein n=1 Tax=Cantharellus anzutake TaxID=1750568 RepID=UPI001904F09B|nr:uncharacterized protein EI90DRAFT_3058677 [Cantharellus anzutake]KAF8331130.1 hypothetical protein EI90DRAFT_3058677 [Cantharellus anzutake]